MENEKVKDKLRKLYELAKRGEAGEKEAAQTALDRLLKKHSLDESDLDDEIEREYEIEFHGKEKLDLLAQVVAKVTDKSHNIYYEKLSRRLRTRVVVKRTAAQRVEIEFLFSFYSSLYDREKEMFFIAFVQKHSLFRSTPPPDREQKNGLTPEEIERVLGMMSGMQNASPNIPIESKEVNHNG